MSYRTKMLTLTACALILWAGVLAGQDTAAVHDKTGLFGPVIDKFWPVVVTFLTSLVVKGIALVNQGFAKTSAAVKWAALYAFALLFNFGARWLGITEVDPLAPVFALTAVQTAAAALVYRFGQHKAPEVAATSKARIQ
jgi:hypothetical protein